jgi:hypothetical protein
VSAPNNQCDLHPENALWAYNSQGGNDKQLKAVIEQYPQVNEVLKKIKPTKKLIK